MTEPISIWRGARVQPFRSDNLRPPAPLDDPVRAERVAVGLIECLDDLAALARIRDAASRAMMALSHGLQRDPGDEDDGMFQGGQGVS